MIVSADCHRNTSVNNLAERPSPLTHKNHRRPTKLVNVHPLRHTSSKIHLGQKARKANKCKTIFSQVALEILLTISQTRPGFQVSAVQVF